MATPVSTIAHHCQFPATPYCRTCWVTQFGVSLLKVVATIESPASHHGTDRPEAKNSEVLLPARLPKKSAGTKQIRMVKTTIAQSRGSSVIRGGCSISGSLQTADCRLKIGRIDDRGLSIGAASVTTVGAQEFVFQKQDFS